MKDQQSVPKLFLGSLVAICALVLAGCAAMESAASQESLLQKAGFQSRTPTTEKQKAAYAALPAYKLHKGTREGRTIYAYKDEKAGVVWLGNNAQYAQYRQLAANANLKEEQITPAEASLEEKDCIRTPSGMRVAFRRSARNCDSQGKSRLPNESREFRLAPTARLSRAAKKNA